MTSSSSPGYSGSAFSVGAFSSGSPIAAVAPVGGQAQRSGGGQRSGAPRTGGRSDAPRSDAPRSDRNGGRDGAGRDGGRSGAPRNGGERRRPADAPRSRPQSDRPKSEPAAQRRAQAPASTLFDHLVIEPVTADSVTSFTELGVDAKLIAPLRKLGAETAFPIQAATLPVSLSGRDVLGRGRTGSGKTIAFAIPLVTRVAAAPVARSARKPRGLVLVPTRELALQVQRTIDPLAAALGLKTMVVFGGVGYGNQTSALRSGVDIVIACPGRLEDLIARNDCDLGNIAVTVLDEADHMADLGFLPGVRRLLRATPANGQRLLFSATLDNGISVLVNDFLTNPAVHAVDDESSKVETMTHHVFAVNKDDRNQVVRELASGGARRLLFTRTKHGAKKWAAALTKNGIPAVDLHGNLSQGARERNLDAFSSGRASVLVATDIAARGIHVDDIELVVHLDPPTEHKAYLHRSGRTARAGAGGTVITLMLPEQADDVRKLMKQAGITAATTRITPGHPEIHKLAG
ncbi:hypothetical protein GCM10009818_02590 [Nakamurella flavida]